MKHRFYNQCLCCSHMGTLGSKGLRVPNEKNTMAQIINEKVKTLCNSKGLKFINFWASYKDNESLQSDGVHLSKKYKEKLGDLINLNL